MTATLVLLAIGSSANAHADEAVTIQKLRDELAERDRIIIDLLHRVEALETGNVAKRGEEDMQPAGEGAPARGAGTGMEIDEAAAERALERTLVQQGARVLGRGQYELDLGFNYARSETRTPTLASIAGNSFVAEDVRRADLFDSRAGFRFGLPFATQLEVSIPYRSIAVDSTLRVDGAVQSTSNRSGSGRGDVRVGLVTRLAEEKSWRPGLVGRLDWQSGSGATNDNGLGLGGGHEALGAAFSASWRRDPVVFLLGGGYTRYFKGDAGELRPGDRVDLSLGAALAVSPETALTFSIDQSFSRDFQLDGVTLPGSDRQSAVFNASASTILGRGILLQFNAGVGLTADAPDYQVGLALPIRLDLLRH